MSEIRLLFVSKNDLDCGNYVTISRIRKNLQLLNKYIRIECFSLINGHNHVQEFIDVSNAFLPDVVIGLNLIRCEFLSQVKKNFKLIMILGGTDINMDVSQEIKEKLKRLIKLCHCIVAFSEEMREVFLNKSYNILENEQKKIHVIPQGIEIQMEIIKNYMKNLDLSMCFVVIGRLRTVKDPNFIVAPYLDWYSIDGHQNYHLLYIGDIEENCDEILAFLENIKNSHNIHHINSVPHSDIFHIMQHSKALINCSKNEGQCTTILEAMALSLPVIARNVPGNKSLIKSEETGLLFNDSDDFKKALTNIIKKEVVNRLIKNALIYVNKTHNPMSEANDYLNIIREVME